MQVLATLTCGWCGREVAGLEGRIDPNRQRFEIASASGVQRYGGWPVCAHCGGPLFVAAWKPVRPAPVSSN